MKYRLPHILSNVWKYLGIVVFTLCSIGVFMLLMGCISGFELSNTDKIQVLSAYTTFILAVAAFFKEEVRCWFIKSKFDIQLDPKGLEESNTLQKGGGLKAAYYQQKLIIENTGNTVALNCGLYILSAVYTSDNITPKEKNLLSKKATSCINGVLSHYIPPREKETLVLLELTEPQKQSSPDGKDGNTPTHNIQILGLESIPIPANEKGKWTIRYSLRQENGESKHFLCIIEWDGKWHQRATEMRSALTVKIEKL